MKKRILSLLLAGVMVLGTLTGCGSKETKTNETTGTEAGTGTETTAADAKPMVIGSIQFSEKFSPFFNESVPDKRVTELVHPYLVTNDRAGAIVYNAIEGETIPYNGVDYNYQGIADVAVTQDEAADKTVYNFKLREGVKFSDGELLTADDIIFNLYVYADSDYDGYEMLNTTPIMGMKNYRANSTAASDITQAEVEAEIANISDQIIENIMTPTLTDELAWCGSLYEDEAYKAQTDEFPVTKDLFAAFYAKDESYDSTKVDTEEQVLKDIIAQYGTDYKALAAAYAGDDTYYDADVTAMAEASVVEKKKAAGEGEEVANIEGIKKLGDYEVEVTTNGYDATVLYRFIIMLAPMHYYGDKALYDYDANKFGFTRGDLSAVREKTTKPMGAGPYKFSKFENKVVYYEANENYWKGVPEIKSVQYKETVDADVIPGVEQGTIDLGNPVGSKKDYEQIRGINSNAELVGDKIVTSASDYRGYGYLGINSKLVNVGGDQASDASKNLRKALATVIAVYRDVTIDSYYGDAASVIDYSISNTSWAAPQKADADYEVAFATDVEGNPLYAEGMSAEDKYAKATEAALGFLEAAGYTVAGGKVTGAPKGAKLTYEVTIPADGTGDHPSFAVLTDAKKALESIGITLEINDITEQNILWDGLNAGTIEMWTAAWQADIDPDMYQLYHTNATSSNYVYISDTDLDAYIMDARTSADQTYRKSIYKECLNIIMDWAVEVPIYQRKESIVYSPERIDETSFTKDVTTFYEWYRDIEKIKMK